MAKFNYSILTTDLNFFVLYFNRILIVLVRIFKKCIPYNNIIYINKNHQKCKHSYNLEIQAMVKSNSPKNTCC